MKKITAFLLFIIFVSLLSFQVNALNSNVSLIISSPGADAGKEVNISWHTTDNDNIVRYTHPDDEDFKNARFVSATCSPVPFEGKTNVVHCKATLSNLSSNTDYIFQVGKTNWSNTHSFKTGGSSGFSFVHISDIHSWISGNSNVRVNSANNLLNKAYSMESDIRFTLISGDAVAYGTEYDYWRDLYAMDTVGQMMYTLTPGNHDYYNRSAVTTNISYFNSVTNHPQNGAQGLDNSTYYFKYGNALFISLESEAAAASAAAVSSQQKWLKEVIARNPADFVIAFTHRPFYTGDGRNAGQAADQRNFFQAIFDECGVDLVLTGHNHVLARTHPVYNNEITETPEGTVYITATAVGDRHQLEEGNPMATVDYYKVGRFDACTIVSVEDDKIILKTIDTSGTVLDTFELMKKPIKLSKFEFIDALSVKSKQNDFSTAIIDFPDLGPGRINSITVSGENNALFPTFFFPSAPLNIIGIPAEANKYTLKVETVFRNGQKIAKQVDLINPEKYFGTIENLRIVDDDRQSFLYWDSALVPGKIEKFDIYINGFFLKSVEPEKNMTILDDISPYVTNEVEFRALDPGGNIMFSDTLSYGNEAAPVDISFEKNIYEIINGETLKISLNISPMQELLLQYNSSDESIATVSEDGTITATGIGSCTITVSVVRRPDISATVGISVISVEEPDPESSGGKKGCFGKQAFIWFLAPGAFMMLLRRKRHI